MAPAVITESPLSVKGLQSPIDEFDELEHDLSKLKVSMEACLHK